MSTLMSSFAFFSGLCNVGPQAWLGSAFLQKGFLQPKAEATFSPVIFSSVRKPSCHSCCQHLLTCQNHSKQCDFCITYIAGHRSHLSTIYFSVCLSLFQDVRQTVLGKAYFGPPNCTALENSSSPRVPQSLAFPKPSGMFESSLVPHLSTVNLKFLRGACVRDAFSLEISDLKYEMLLLTSCSSRIFAKEAMLETFIFHSLLES